MAQYLCDFVVKDSYGKDWTMRDLLKPVTLIVNVDCNIGHDVNTECSTLQEVYLRNKDKGFEIIAFPCDQFQLTTKQECDALLVQSDLAKRYHVTFPIMHKINVNGQKAHPLFMYLQTKLSGFPTDAIKWDFTKFLIVNGEPQKRYAPTTSPLSIESDIVSEFAQNFPQSTRTEASTENIDDKKEESSHDYSSFQGQGHDSESPTLAPLQMSESSTPSTGVWTSAPQTRFKDKQEKSKSPTTTSYRDTGSDSFQVPAQDTYIEESPEFRNEQREPVRSEATSQYQQEPQESELNVEKESLQVPPPPKDEYIELKQTPNLATETDAKEQQDLRNAVQGVWSDGNISGPSQNAPSQDDPKWKRGSDSGKDHGAEREAWLNRQSTESGPFGTTPQLELHQQRQSGAGMRDEQARWLAFRDKPESEIQQGQGVLCDPMTDVIGPDPTVSEHVPTNKDVGESAQAESRNREDKSKWSGGLNEGTFSGSGLDSTTSWTPFADANMPDKEPFTLSREDLQSHGVQSDMAFAHTPMTPARQQEEQPVPLTQPSDLSSERNTRFCGGGVDIESLPEMRGAHWPMSDDSPKKEGDPLMEDITKTQKDEPSGDVVGDFAEQDTSHGSIPRSQATVSDDVMDFGMIKHDPGDHGLEQEKA